MSSATGASTARSVAGGGGPPDAAGLARVLWAARRPVPRALEIPARARAPRLARGAARRSARPPPRGASGAGGTTTVGADSSSWAKPNPAAMPACTRLPTARQPPPNKLFSPSCRVCEVGGFALRRPEPPASTLRSSSDRAPSCDRQATYSKCRPRCDSSVTLRVH